MTLSVKEIQAIEATLPNNRIALLPKTTMSVGRVKEIEKFDMTPEEALEYAFIKNNSWTIEEALEEHGLDMTEPEPEDALEYAIDNIPRNILTTLLNAHGYQPIPKSKQAKRDNAMLIKPY